MNDVVTSHKIVLQIIKASSPNLTRPSLDAFRPFWTHQQGLSPHHQIPKPHICNNMENVVLFYRKVART